jgi:hypothetical protein
MGRTTWGSVGPTGNQYLSTIDATGRKADDEVVGRQEGTPL